MERETTPIITGEPEVITPEHNNNPRTKTTDDLLELEEITFTQNSKDIKELAAKEDALVPYKTKSNASYKMGTLIPKNMLFEVQKALNDLTKEKGDIDVYVRNELKYVSTATLWKALAAEQVDGIGLYLRQFGRDQGIIIADQTGIGKGRQAAAVIRHALVNDCIPIFFTKSPNLFSDMYRDMIAIGMQEIAPFILNTDSASKIKDADGNVVFAPLSPNQQLETLTTKDVIPTDSPQALRWFKENGRKVPDLDKEPTLSLYSPISHLPTDYNMIFTTYSQVQSAHPYKRSWIKELVASQKNKTSKLAKKVVFILDESHLAGGYDSIIGRWMRAVLPHTKACCFLSATFAKYPEVMPFYAQKTAISQANMKDENLVQAMRSGGLALQEIIASNLAESGQLIRRQRSNEGVDIQYKVLDQEPQRSEHRQSVNSIIKLMNEVVHFETTYIRPLLDEIHSQAYQIDDRVKKPPAGLGVKQAPYFSRVFTIVDQMLFALKVQDVARETLRLLREDKKVVIAFKSTMGAFLKELNLSNGDRMELKDLDFVRTLLKGLESIFYYNYTDVERKKSKKRIALNQLPPKGQKEYKRIRTAILSEQSGLSISPIDQLIELIESVSKPSRLAGHGQAHFKVAEVTGRNQRIAISTEQGVGVATSFRSDAEKAFRLFNRGDFDVLLINQSGSTGASAHSSKEFKDQRQRTMIVHQFELDINIEMQKLGRINRTGQVNTPSYLYLTTDIPLEIRLMTMLKSKLKMLDANTTGSQKTNETTFESHDIFNKYGDSIAWDWVNENAEMAEKMGNPTYHKTWGGDMVRNESKSGAIRQVTGRAGLLLVEDQERLYNDLLRRYEHKITLEKQQGTYDLETEFLPLDAVVKKRYLQQQGMGGTTPFGKDTIREQTIVNNLKRPFTKNEVEQRILKVLDNKKPEVIREQLKASLLAEYPQMMERRISKKQELVTHAKERIAALAQLGSKKKQEDNDILEHKHEKAQDFLARKQEELLSFTKELEHIRTRISRYIGYWQIGELVKIPYVGALREPSWGIFLGVAIDKSLQNPYTLSNVRLSFVTSDSRKSITYSCKEPEDAFIARIYEESKDITEKDRQTIPITWNELIKKSSSKREQRQILTQNILAISDMVGTSNKLIKYNTLDGRIKNGVLLFRDFGKNGELQMLVPISHGLKAIETLAIGNTFEDHKLGVRFKRISSGYLQVFFRKKEHRKPPLDAQLRELILPESGQHPDELPNFVQNASEMTGVLSNQNIASFLKILDTYDIKLRREARELQKWELENLEDWKQRTTTNDARFSYELGHPYGQASNPQSGFKDYKEPSTDYPFGIVIYDRRLSDKEKYRYHLIPIYTAIDIPYLEWKSQIAETALHRDFKKLVAQAKNQPLYKAKDTLGNFIYNHPQEGGNSEFVFGRYDAHALGMAAYVDEIAPISELDELLDQLQLYHQFTIAS